MATGIAIVHNKPEFSLLYMPNCLQNTIANKF